MVMQLPSACATTPLAPGGELATAAGLWGAHRRAGARAGARAACAKRCWCPPSAEPAWPPACHRPQGGMGRPQGGMGRPSLQCSQGCVGGMPRAVLLGLLALVQPALAAVSAQCRALRPSLLHALSLMLQQAGPLLHPPGTACPCF